MGLKELLSALSDSKTKADLTKAEQEQMIRRVVVETLAEKSNTYEHNEILKRMLDVLECSVVQPTKQEEKKSTMNLEELNILIKNLTTKGSHSKEQMNEQKKSGRDKMFLDLMLQLKEFNARSSSSHADLDRSEQRTTTDRRSRFDNDKHSGQRGGLTKQGNQNFNQRGGRGKSQTRQEKPFGVFNPPQREDYDHHQSSGGQARALNPPGSYLYNHQAPNYRRGSPRRDDYSQPPPSNRDKSWVWVDPPNHHQAANYGWEQARGVSPRSEEHHRQATYSCGGQGRGGNPRRDDYSQPPPSNRDKSWVGPANPQSNDFYNLQRSNNIPNEGFYNVVAGPLGRGTQYHQDGYQQNNGPNALLKGYDNNHQTRGPINQSQQDNPWKQNYQNVAPQQKPNNQEYQNNPAQQRHYQSNVQTQHRGNYGGNRGNYRGRGFGGQNRPFGRGARHMHSEDGSMNNHRQPQPNMSNWVQDGSTRNSNPSLNLTPGEITSIKNIIKKDTNAKGASKKNNETTFKSKKPKPTQKKSPADEDLESDDSSEKSTKAEAVKTGPTFWSDSESDDSSEKSTKAEAVKTDEKLKLKKKKKKKKAATTEKEKTKNDSGVAINKGNTTEEAEVDSEASQVEKKSDTMTRKEVKSNSGVANAEGKSEPLKLFVASGYIVDLPEGVNMDQEIDDVVFMAKDEEGKIFSFQPKTVGELAEFKKKYPNAQAIVVR